MVFSTMSLFLSNISWAALFAISSESYKTDVRNSGVGWANAAAKIGGILGPLIGGIILDTPGGFFISIVMACIMFIITAIASCMFTETRGKPLDD